MKNMSPIELCTALIQRAVLGGDFKGLNDKAGDHEIMHGLETLESRSRVFMSRHVGEMRWNNGITLQTNHQ